MYVIGIRRMWHRMSPAAWNCYSGEYWPGLRWRSSLARQRLRERNKRPMPYHRRRALRKGKNSETHMCMRF